MSEPPILSAPRVRLQARFLWICAGLFLGAAVLGYLCAPQVVPLLRSEEHTSELQSH